jgi:hypothetical protein
MVAPERCPRCQMRGAMPHPSHVTASGPELVTGIACPVAPDDERIDAAPDEPESGAR